MRQIANNKMAMKLENRREVLSLIHRHPISRVGLARETGLTQSAISSIINELLTEGIVLETGKQDAAALGRKPVFVDLNPGWGYIVGISIDHEGFEVGITDLKGGLIGPVSRIGYDAEVPRALDRIARAAAELIQASGIPPERIVGVGAIAPGPVDAKAGRIRNPPLFEPWHGLELKKELQSRLPYRIEIQHNSNALTRAEHCMGAGSRFNSFALFVINAGIGFGLVLNGQIYTGPNGLGCEIGHTSIAIDGKRCPCGNRGCLELYASTSALLYEAGHVQPEITAWEQLVDRAWSGDPYCERLLEDQARCLAHSILNLDNLLALDAVIITGLGAYRGELLIDKIKGQISRSMLTKGSHKLRIIKTALLENAPVIAASTVITDQLFEGDLYSRLVDGDKGAAAQA